jgi:hypothetical protein
MKHLGHTYGGFIFAISERGMTVGHTLCRLRLRLGGYVPKVVYESIQCLKVSGDWEEWSASHVDGPPVIHLSKLTQLS